MSEKLSDVFLNSAVKNFGDALRRAVRPLKEDGKEKLPADYASLVELEYVETPDQFKEVLWKFLRRFDVTARKHDLKRPNEKDLDELIKLVDDYGVKRVRAALISHALVESSKEEGDK